MDFLAIITWLFGMWSSVRFPVTDSTCWCMDGKMQHRCTRKDSLRPPCFMKALCDSNLATMATCWMVSSWYLWVDLISSKWISSAVGNSFPAFFRIVMPDAATNLRTRRSLFLWNKRIIWALRIHIMCSLNSARIVPILKFQRIVV